MKIIICIPFGYNFEPAKSGLKELKNQCHQVGERDFQYEDILIHVEPRCGTYPKSEVRDSYLNSNIAQVRKELIDLSYDKMVYIDADIIWHFIDLIKLVRHGNQIVTAPYLGHTESNVFMCGTWDEPGKNHKLMSGYTTGIFPVDWVGLGFISIDREVFENIDKPYFYCPIFTAENGDRYQLGEDVGFCTNVWQKYKIMCNFDIQLKHEPGPKVNWAF